MKECDNSKIHISSNFILPISLLIMFDTLLLRPSLHCNTPLHFTTLHPTKLYDGASIDNLLPTLWSNVGSRIPINMATLQFAAVSKSVASSQHEYWPNILGLVTLESWLVGNWEFLRKQMFAEV